MAVVSPPNFAGWTWRFAVNVPGPLFQIIVPLLVMMRAEPVFSVLLEGVRKRIPGYVAAASPLGVVILW